MNMVGYCPCCETDCLPITEDAPKPEDSLLACVTFKVRYRGEHQLPPKDLLELNGISILDTANLVVQQFEKELDLPHSFHHSSVSLTE